MVVVHFFLLGQFFGLMGSLGPSKVTRFSSMAASSGISSYSQLLNLNGSCTFSSNSERASVNRDRTVFIVCTLSALVNCHTRLVVVFRRTHGPRVEDMLIDKVGKSANGSSPSSNTLVVGLDNPSFLTLPVRLSSPELRDPSGGHLFL